MHELFRIELLGALCLEVGETRTTRFRTQKTAELLAYLAYFRRAHPREILIDLLWPECDPEDGRHSLSMALSALRPLLTSPAEAPGNSALLVDRQSVGLNWSAVRTDVMEFETALNAAERSDSDTKLAFLTIGIDLYRGELLRGYYSDWVFSEQLRLEEMYFQAIRQTITYLEAAGELDRALQYALRSVTVNRLREEAHQEVIRLYTASGNRSAALRQYRSLEQILNRETESGPSEETAALLTNSELGSAMRDGVEAIDCGGPRTPAMVDFMNVHAVPAAKLDPVGGAVRLSSQFYLVRPTDELFHEAIDRRDSIVLVKGARQIGKTSLLARGLAQARNAGARAVLTTFQAFNAEQLETAQTLLLALADSIAEQLELDPPGPIGWDTRRGPSPNFRRYLRREVLSKLSEPLVWGMDDVDMLFGRPYCNEVFGLFRSWHDERALEENSPWEALTMVMAYSTEAHLFITDANQSPFNVGTRLPLEDFTPDHVSDLNRRYGSPLKDSTAVERYFSLVNGHPFLVRRGLHEMVTQSISLQEVQKRATSDDWIFGEHLRRIALMVGRNADLADAVRAVIMGKPCPNQDSFYRLRTAGILAGESVHEPRFRCALYAGYLTQQLC